jgi:hypothetical protein
VVTARELTEALKQFPLDAKVHYEMGPNGPATIVKAQNVKPWGEQDEMGGATGPIAPEWEGLSSSWKLVQIQPSTIPTSPGQVRFASRFQSP